MAAAKAAPLAKKAGDATAGASDKLAERSKTWAAGVRAAMDAEAPKSTTEGVATAAGETAAEAAGDVRAAATDVADAATETASDAVDTAKDIAADAADVADRHQSGRSSRRPRRSRPRSVYFAAMSVRPIVMLGDPRLRLKGLPVDSFGKYLHELLDDLAHTMRDAPGVGLAAPQLGEALQACVIEVENHLYELVNPRIVRSAGDDRDLEGCLSIPGYVAYVTRREKVWVVAQDRHGQKIKVAGSGLLGRALQHELDHLDGRLYIDYLDSMDELIEVGQGNEDDDEVAEATSALA